MSTETLELSGPYKLFEVHDRTGWRKIMWVWLEEEDLLNHHHKKPD